MAKDKDKTKSKDMPAPEQEFTPDMAKLTPEQQRIAGYVSTAKKDPPKLKIENIEEMFTRVEMEVPKDVIRGPEYSYAWLAVDGLSSSVYTGSKWEIVTRSNHSHAPDRYFGQDGAITYKGQNILAFCYREIQDAEEAAIVKDYNQKTEKATETKEVVEEGASRVDPGATGKVFNEVDLPDDGNDFGAPQ